MLSPRVSAPFAAVALCGAVVAGAATTVAAPAEKRAFNLPRGDAAVTLRQFAAAAGTPIIYLVDRVRGVTTNAVSGELAPRDALERMLAGSALEAAQDAATGALVVSRKRTAVAAPPAGEVGPVSDPQSKPNPSVTKSIRPRPLFAAFAGWLTAFAAASGISAEGQLPRTESAEAPVALSPFTVVTSKDTGYQAIDSLAGGRIATNVLKTPADQTILTREFLDDIAADNYIDAGRWLPNATVTPSGGTDFGQGVTFRGVSPAGYPYRNYFRSLGPVDDYIVERLDSARGPNSLIFADGVIGGIINTNTKRAQFGRARTELRTRFDSEGSWRGAFDANRVLTDRLAARINLVASDEKRYNLFEQERLGAHLAVSFRPWRKGEFRVEAEAQDLKFWGSTTSRFTEQVSSWDGIRTVTGPLTANPGNGVSRLTTSKVSYGTAFESTGPLDFLNFGQTAGSGVGISEPARRFNVPLPRVDRTFQFITPNAPSLQRQVALGVYFEQEVSERFAFEVAAHRSRQDRTTNPNGGTGNYWIDVNTLLPNGQPNPKLGHAYTETNADQSSGDNRNTDVRAAAVYTFPFQTFRQRVNVLAGWREEDFVAVTERYSRSNGTNPDLRNAANLTILRRYLSDGARQNLVRPANGRNGYNFDWVRTQDRFQKQDLRNLQVATVGAYFDDRLNVIAGAGYYSYKQYQMDILAVGPNGKPARRGYSAITEPIDTVRSSVGAVYFPIPSVGVYVNRSSSFTPVTSGDPGLDGKQFDPTDGQGYGAGLRFNLFAGKVAGSAGYYNSSEKDRVTQFGSSEINSIWSDLSQTQNQIPTTNYRDRLDYEASGYEAEITANIFKGLRLFANISFPETKQTNTIRGTRAYLATHLAAWQAAADDPAQFNRQNIQNQINNLKLRLDAAAEGRPLNGTQKFTANIFANYTLQSTAFKGLRLGGGANFVGRRLIGNQLNRPFDYYYGEARYLLTATAGYDLKVRKVPVSLQLNVSNLLDYDRPIFTGVATPAIANTRAVGNGFYYEEPRKFTFSAHLRF